MDITPGPVAFTYVSEFLSLITPTELPLGKFVLIGGMCVRVWLQEVMVVGNGEKIWVNV